jgi:GcrA cell cycle regulator
MPFTWNEQTVETLKKLWSEGLSASQIAAELGGITRNAVIGKVHRLGLSVRKNSYTSLQRKPRAAGAPSGPKPRTQYSAPLNGKTFPNPKPTAPQPLPEERKTEVPPRHLTLGELVTGTERVGGSCRWAYGDNPFTFCGHPQQIGRPYCPFHTALAYQPLTGRDRRIDARDPTIVRAIAAPDADPRPLDTLQAAE